LPGKIGGKQQPLHFELFFYRAIVFGFQGASYLKLGAGLLYLELGFSSPLFKEIAMKRNLFLFAVLSCLTLMLAALNPVRAAHHTESGAKVPTAYGSCHSACSKCQEVCETTLAYCSKQAGEHKNTAHIKALQDCIATCKMSEDFMTRGSQLSHSVCNLCEEACKKCAESCETFKDDKQMKACAEECRKCAESCQTMKS